MRSERAKTTGSALAAALLCAISTPAAAGGLALPVRGVRALSVGGAFVAGAEGPNALWYNPANLGESELGVEVGLVSLGASFTPSQGAQAGATVENQGRPLPNPTLGLTYRVSDALSIGLGAFAPYAGFERFDEAGPQRYSLVESDRSTVLYLALGAAVRVGRLRVGPSLQNVLAHVQQRVALSGYTGLFGYPQDPTLDVLQELDLADEVNLTGNLGAALDAGPFTFGLAVQLPFTVSGEATSRMRLPSSVFFDGLTVEGDQLSMELPFPLMVRGGVLWRAADWAQVEAAVGFENWSVQDRLVIGRPGQLQLHGVPGVGDYAVPPQVIDRRMRDTLSIHLGADLELAEGLHLRGGLFLEPSAFGDATFSVAQLDGDKLGLTLGGSFDVGPVRLELAASRVFQATRSIGASELTQLNPTNPAQAEVVGNGTYTSGLWVAGLGAAWRFAR